jgi:hypothetical protein
LPSSQVRTPIQDAYATYRKMRSRGGYRNLDQEGRGWYFSFRSLRNYSRGWANYKKESLSQMAVSSHQSYQDWITRWQPLVDWFGSQEITPEKFIAVNGGGFTLSDLKRISSNATSRWSDIYRSANLVFTLNRNRIIERFQRVIDSVEDFDPSNPIEFIRDRIIEAANAIGLTEYEEFTDSDDGAVWLEDQDGTRFFYLMGMNHPKYSPYRITATIGSSQNYERFLKYPWIDLSRGVIGRGSAEFPDLPRILRDYATFKEITKYLDMESAPASIR